MSGTRQTYNVREESERPKGRAARVYLEMKALERRASRGTKSDRWKMLAGELKRKWLGLELHHVYGRIGRLLYCRLFIVPLKPDAHRGPGCGALTRNLRDEMRRHFLAYEKANARNMDKGECWYADCPERDRCALTAELKDDDGGDE